MTVIHERAYAKVNLCLLLGPLRADGRHELVTIYESVDLFDDLRIELPSPTGSDAVSCAGVVGPNLVEAAIAALRSAGWSAPPVSVEIVKRIPIAAGMGGGSADAAALLRCASQLSPGCEAVVEGIAASLGADVPSQLAPGVSLGLGAGEIVRALDALEPHAMLVVPQPFGLATADVYREADRLGLGRSSEELAAWAAELVLEFPPFINDLQAAALSLAPSISDAVDASLAAGCESAIVCGSGPTVIGLCRGPDAFGLAQDARAAVVERYPAATVVSPVRRPARGGDGVPAANP